MEAALFAGFTACGAATLVLAAAGRAEAASGVVLGLLLGAILAVSGAIERRAHAEAGGTGDALAALALLLGAVALGAARMDAAAQVLAALAGPLCLRYTAERQHLHSGRVIPGGADALRPKQVLKSDCFGRIEAGEVDGPSGTEVAVRRDFRAGSLWLRPVAAVLARREARALGWLEPVPRVPRLLDLGRGRLLRSFVAGTPLAEAAPCDPEYFAEARRLLSAIHRLGVTHNDTHKVHNWLVTPDGRPALVDFQIAGRHAARTRWFRLCALEDVRHLLKHKRTLCPEALTRRERSLLARRSWIARGWLATVKPLYVFVTRRLLDWRDGEGRGRLRRPR